MLLALSLLACKSEQQLEVVEQPQPALTLQAPAAGAWMPPGTTSVEGAWEALEQVAVNGEQAELTASGAWSGRTELVPGINLIEARGTDVSGDQHFQREAVLAGSFAAPGAPVDDAAVLRLNEEGLDLVMDLAAELVTADALGEQIGAMNPVYETAVDVLGWEAASLDAGVDSLSFDTPRLEANPAGGLLYLQVALPDLWVDLSAYGEVVEIDYDVGASIWADNAYLTGTIGVDAVDGQLQVDIVDLGIELSGFGYDLSLIPWDLEEYLFVDTVRAKIEEMLVEQLAEQVPAMIEELLAGLDLSFELDLLGTPLSVGATFADAWIDDHGIVLATDIDVAAGIDTTRPYDGWLIRGAGRPDLPTEGPLVVGLSDDFLNRLLFEVWRGGVLDLTLSTADGSLEPALLAMLHADEGAIGVDPVLPPVVIGDDQGLELQVGELGVALDTPGGELGDHLLLASTAFIPLDVAVEDSELKLRLGDVDLTLMVRDSDWGAGDEATTQLVEEMLPIDTLLALATAQLGLEIPAIQGLVIDSATTARHGDGAHTVVTVELGFE